METHQTKSDSAKACLDSESQLFGSLCSWLWPNYTNSPPRYHPLRGLRLHHSPAFWGFDSGQCDQQPFSPRHVHLLATFFYQFRDHTKTPPATGVTFLPFLFAGSIIILLLILPTKIVMKSRTSLARTSVTEDGDLLLPQKMGGWTSWSMPMFFLCSMWHLSFLWNVHLASPEICSQLLLFRDSFLRELWNSNLFNWKSGTFVLD